jgi:clan AA aspartic protease
MGKVMVKIKLSNLVDEKMVERGLLRPEEVRTLEVEGLVDTGATALAIPADVAEKLGLTEIRRVDIGLADGTRRQIPVVDGVSIEILGRGMSGDAFVLPAGSTPLIGQIELERLDLVVNPKSRELMPNPAHPDGPLLDLLRVA